MNASRFINVFLTLAVAAAFSGAASPARAATKPSQQEIDQVSVDLESTNAAGIEESTQKLRGWVDGGWISLNLPNKWLPALEKNKRYQDIADMSLSAIRSRPGPDVITTLLDFRVRSLMILNKYEDAQQAAKSYYNVCDYRLTGKAVDYLAQCLIKTHPEDPEIGRRFRSEQAIASIALTADSKLAGDLGKGSPILKTVKVEDSPFASAIAALADKPNFGDRVGYGNLLLVADKPAEAEAVFRELFLGADTNEEYVMASEGLAKALRAKDGTVARSNAFLASIQPVAAPKPPATPAPKTPAPKTPATPAPKPAAKPAPTNLP